MTSPLSRRDFLQALTAGLALAGLSPVLAGEKTKTPKTAIPTRPLGKTGYEATIFALGGQAKIEERGERDSAVEIINRALDLGVNYFDTAPAYGPSQDYFGAVLKTRRKEVFLASKTHNRSRDGSLRLLEDSLTRLNTDHLDLWQLHNINDQEDLDQIFSKNGAIHALEIAREQKMVRFFGITGHYDPRLLVQGIERYPFDCTLCALNAADRHHLSFIETLLPMATKKQMGIIGMKVPARGSIFRKDGLATMKQAMDYVLTLPVSTIIVGCSTVAELEENVRIAKEFKPLSEREMAQLEDLTRPYARQASWFKDWA